MSNKLVVIDTQTGLSNDVKYLPNTSSAFTQPSASPNDAILESGEVQDSISQQAETGIGELEITNFEPYTGTFNATLTPTVGDPITITVATTANDIAELLTDIAFEFNADVNFTTKYSTAIIGTSLFIETLNPESNDNATLDFSELQLVTGIDTVIRNITGAQEEIIQKGIVNIDNAVKIDDGVLSETYEVDELDLNTINFPIDSKNVDNEQYWFGFKFKFNTETLLFSLMDDILAYSTLQDFYTHINIVGGELNTWQPLQNISVISNQQDNDLSASNMNLEFYVDTVNNKFRLRENRNELSNIDNLNSVSIIFADNRTYGLQGITLPDPNVDVLVSKTIELAVETISSDFPTGTVLTSVSQAPNNPNVIYMCGDAGVLYKSIDKGRTWVSLNSTTVENLQKVVAVSEDLVYIAGNSGDVRKSINGGGNFTSIAPAGITGTVRSLDAIGDVVYIGTIDGSTSKVYKSINAGVDWTDLTPNIGGTINNFQNIQVLSENVAYLVGNFTGNFRKTVDGGASWTGDISIGGGGILTDLSFLNENVGYVCGGSSLLYKTKDAGNTWTELTISPSVGNFGNIAAINEFDVIVRSSTGNFLYTVNGFETHTLINYETNLPRELVFTDDNEFLFVRFESVEIWNKAEVQTRTITFSIDLEDKVELLVGKDFTTSTTTEDILNKFIGNYEVNEKQVTVSRAGDSLIATTEYEGSDLNGRLMLIESSENEYPIVSNLAFLNGTDASGEQLAALTGFLQPVNKSRKTFSPQNDDKIFLKGFGGFLLLNDSKEFDTQTDIFTKKDVEDNFLNTVSPAQGNAFGLNLHIESMANNSHFYFIGFRVVDGVLNNEPVSHISNNVSHHILFRVSKNASGLIEVRRMTFADPAKTSNLGWNIIDLTIPDIIVSNDAEEGDNISLLPNRHLSFTYPQSQTPFISIGVFPNNNNQPDEVAEFAKIANKNYGAILDGGRKFVWGILADDNSDAVLLRATTRHK